MNQFNSDYIKIIKADSKRKFLENLSECEKEKNLRVVILEISDEAVFSENNEHNKKLIEKIENFPKPLILVLRTHARGFLFELLLVSHLCIALNSARFEISNLEKTEKQIGSKNAGKLKFIQGDLAAETALELGLLNKISSGANLEDEAFETARQISKLAPFAVRSCLEAVNKGLAMNLKEGLELETELFRRIFTTEDFREGINAFFEKREAVFRGR